MILDALNAAVSASFYMAPKVSGAAMDEIRYDLALFAPQGV
jgi:hypothetical protein